MISLDGFFDFDSAPAMKSKFSSRVFLPKQVSTNLVNYPTMSSSKYVVSKTGIILSSSGMNLL